MLSNFAGYVALRLTLYPASESIASSVAADLSTRAARSILQTGRLAADVRQAGGVSSRRSAPTAAS